MVTKGPPSYTLSIFLLEQASMAPGDVFKEPKGLTRHRVDHDGRSLGSLYVQKRPLKATRWSKIFDGVTTPALPEILTSSSAAIWLLDVGGHGFALSFGYGASLLKPFVWQERFGLLVTLNCIEPGTVRSVDKTTVDSLHRQTRVQSTRAGDLRIFGLHPEQDLLRAVTGRPVNASFGKRMSGLDSLAVTVPFELGDLPNLLLGYHSQFQSKDYLKHWDWIDQISPVRNPALISKLGVRLLAALQSPGTEHLSMAAPEPLDWSRVGGFSYSSARDAETYEDLLLDDLIDELGDLSKLSIDKLKNKTVLVSDAASGFPLTHWPVFKALYYECTESGAVYFLSSGQWFKADQGYVKALNKFVGSIEGAALMLPKYAHIDEEAYNKEAAKASAGELALMDRKTISYGGGKSKIEFCDLFSQSNEIVHVKRYGSSDDLCHLFDQAVVSADLFFRDKEFREALNAKLPASHRLADPKTNPDAGDFSIILAVVASSRPIVEYPLFARIGLRNAVKRLDALGCKAQLLLV